MYVYFDKNESFEAAVSKTSANELIKEIFGKMVVDYEGCPRIEMSDDPDTFYANKKLKEFFMKATIATFPKFSTNIYENRRVYGIYKYGAAQAELIPGANTDYWLRIETSSWEGVRDMKSLQEKLWAGTLAPTVSYEGKQKKQSPYNILLQILDGRNLSSLQRFILAFRLSGR